MKIEWKKIDWELVWIRLEQAIALIIAVTVFGLIFHYNVIASAK